jgi:deferrochelatase/peroxidase EfeB
MADEPTLSTAAPGPGSDGGALLRRGAVSRRHLLAGSGLATAGLLAAVSGGVAGSSGVAGPVEPSESDSQIVPFGGAHQAGIATSAQRQLAFAAFDVTATTSRDLISILSTWTTAAAAMTAGRPVPAPKETDALESDTGEALGLGPSRLTLTVGFGPSLFDGRFGLASKRPAALADLPTFAGDQLDALASNGDLCIQACADDAQVAFHALHNLARLALGLATIRYLQLGFGRTSSTSSTQNTPRNLLGFKDGTDNLQSDNPSQFDRFVWAGSDTDQPWMAKGTYLVARRIRTRIEAWDRSPVAQQEATIGRSKLSGAPLGSRREHDPVDLAAVGPGGTPIIPMGAHIRQASPHLNGGVGLLRRGYSFSNGIDPQTGELDVGLYFICFQRDPRMQFVRIQERLASDDQLSQYVTHTSSALFACPPGIGPGDNWSSALFS